MSGGRRAVTKGKEREREVQRIVRKVFPEAARTGHAQGEGGEHARPDIDGVPGLWLSVKGGKAPRVLDACAEATTAAKRHTIGQLPAVAFRRDGNRTWWVAVPLSYLMRLLEFRGRP